MRIVRVQPPGLGADENADWWLSTVARVLSTRRRFARRSLFAVQPDAKEPPPADDDGDDSDDNDGQPAQGVDSPSVQTQTAININGFSHSTTA